MAHWAAMNDQSGNAGPQPVPQPQPDQAPPPPWYPGPQPYPGLQPYPAPQPYPGPQASGQQPWYPGQPWAGQPGPPPGYGPVVPWGPPPRPPVLPSEPVRYSQMLRGPRHRWWKPLLTMLLTGAIVLGVSIVAVVPPLVVGLATGVPDLDQYVFGALTDTANFGPAGFIGLNLTLILLIPAVMFSVWAVHGLRPRYLMSVTGGIRWGWMGQCLRIVVPVWVVFVGLSLVIDQPSGPRPAHWVTLLVIVMLMTPFQAAGEEYFFRGWIMQVLGSWFARPVVGLVVTTAISTVTFSAAHGSSDPWVFGSIACLAVAGCLATWRTGGLEAAIAMHAVNNVLALFSTILFGGWDRAFISAGTEGTFLQFAASVVVHALALALIWRQARRAGLSPLTRADPRPALAPPGAPLPATGWQPTPSGPTSG